MRYIVFCSNCNFTGSEEETKISSLPKCPECKKILRYTGVTQDDWRAKSKDIQLKMKQKISNFIDTHITGGYVSV